MAYTKPPCWDFAHFANIILTHLGAIPEILLAVQAHPENDG
jgi:hypothetical protein